MIASLVFILALGTAAIQDPAAVRQSETDFARGVALQQTGDYAGAREAYEAALRTVPNRIDALSNLGVIYARLGQYGEAIKRYRQALSIEPKQLEVRLNLGLAFYKTQEFELSVRELSQVVQEQPTNYQARFMRGLCNYQLNKLSEAISDFETVYSAKPDDIATAYALGTAYIAANETAKAAPLVDKVFRQINTAEGPSDCRIFLSGNEADAESNRRVNRRESTRSAFAHTSFSTW
jgi:tetratricopeptide (TPR) repeat protein